MSPMLCFLFDVVAPATVEGIRGESSGESAWPAESGESASPAESGLIVESGEPSKNDNGEERSDVVRESPLADAEDVSKFQLLTTGEKKWSRERQNKPKAPTSANGL